MAAPPARGCPALFAALLLAYVLSQFFRAFLAVVANDLSRDLGLDSAGLGTLAASWFFAFALAQFPIGLALDRFGPRRTLSLGMSAAVAGAAWLSVSRGLADASIAMGLIGLGCAPVLMSGFYVIARNYPADRFATLSSLLLGLGSLGDPLSGMPLALAVSHTGWRWTIAAMAGVTALSAVLIAMLLRDPLAVAAPRSGRSLVRNVGAVVGLRPLWPLVPVALVSYAFVISTRGLWISPYLEQVHGFDLSARSLVATAMGIAMAGGALLYAPLNRLLGGPKRTATAGLSITVVGWLALGLIGHQGAAGAVALLLLVGCFGAPFAIVMAHARSFMPAHLLGLGVTLMNLLFMGGVSLGQWLSGLYVHAAELAGAAPSAIYGRLFVAFGVILLCALLVYRRSPPEIRAGA